MRRMVAAGVACLCASSFWATANAKTKAVRRGPLMRALSGPSALHVPKYRRDGARIKKILAEHFAVLAPHLVEVVRDCPRPRDLVRLSKKTSPYVLASPRHAGPHFVRKSLLDKLVFAGSFARQRGGYKIAVAVARRTLRDQATLWNYRLLERFAALRRARPKAAPARLARLARPSGEVANPRAYGCGAPHLTGGAVDVVLLSADDEVLVGFERKFFYGTKKLYRKRFLLSKSEDAVHARLLEEIMHAAGFVRYCREAWHFEAGPTMLYRTWRRAGRPGRCYGAGKGGSWDPRREHDADRVADLLVGLPRS